MKILLVAIALAIAAIVAGTFFFGPFSGTAFVRLFCWPSGQVNVDGLAATEAPAPQEIVLSAGRHTFVFQARTGGPAMEVKVRLNGGKRYVLRADLEERTYSLENAK